MSDPRSQSPERVNWELAYTEQLRRADYQLKCFLRVHKENVKLKRQIKQLEAQLNDRALKEDKLEKIAQYGLCNAGDFAG